MWVFLWLIFFVFCSMNNEIGILPFMVDKLLILSHNFNQTMYFSNILLCSEWLFFNQLNGLMNTKNPPGFNHSNDFSINFVQMVSFLSPNCFPVWERMPPLLYGGFPITTSNPWKSTGNLNSFFMSIFKVSPS